MNETFRHETIGHDGAHDGQPQHTTEEEELVRH
jgi:hypothetical protein